MVPSLRTFSEIVDGATPGELKSPLPTFVERMVPPGRLERPTTGLGNQCSIHLSYGG